MKQRLQFAKKGIYNSRRLMTLLSKQLSLYGSAVDIFYLLFFFQFVYIQSIRIHVGLCHLDCNYTIVGIGFVVVYSLVGIYAAGV